MKKAKEIKTLQKTAKIKLVVMSVALLLPFILFPYYIVLFDGIRGLTSTFIQAVVFIATVKIIIAKIITYIRIISNDEFAVKVTVKKEDERNLFIKNKVHSFVLKFIVYVNVISLFVAGIKGNAYVFYTLLANIVLLVGTVFITQIYYNKKY